MKKSVRILSLVTAVLLAGLFVAALIFACLGQPWSGGAAMACILTAFMLSILLYGTMVLLKNKNKDLQNEEE